MRYDILFSLNDNFFVKSGKFLLLLLLEEVAEQWKVHCVLESEASLLWKNIHGSHAAKLVRDFF